jgi:hypothetical protein
MIWVAITSGVVIDCQVSQLSQTWLHRNNVVLQPRADRGWRSPCPAGIEPVSSNASGDLRADSDVNTAPRGSLESKVCFMREASGDALDDRRVRRRIVSQHKERASVGAAVEPGLEAILYILRSAADEKRSDRGGSSSTVSREAGFSDRTPDHAVVWPRDEAVEAHHRVPEQLVHYRAPFYVRVRVV